MFESGRELLQMIGINGLCSVYLMSVVGDILEACQRFFFSYGFNDPHSNSESLGLRFLDGRTASIFLPLSHFYTSLQRRSYEWSICEIMI